MAKEKVKLVGEATEAQIAQWKRQYGNIFAIEVNLDDEGTEKAVGYFREPDLKTLSLVSRLADDNIKAGEALLENLWLGGDERFKTDDSVKLGAFQQLPNLVNIRQSALKKL